MLGDVVLVFDPRTMREEIARFANRLAARGVSTRSLSIGASNGPNRPDLIEAPGLARPWTRPWTARGLRKRAEFHKTSLLHVLQSEWDSVAIALAESWEVPYLLNVDEFPSPGSGVRLSRRWCRGLIAPCRDLADELRAGLPNTPVSVVPPAFLVPKPIERDPSVHRVRVVGAAGPLTSGSGLTTFLKAAAILVEQGSDAEFVIAGDGPDEFELRRYADHLRIADRVTFTGDPDPDAPFWRVLDVFCQTASRPTSARPLAIALAHAIPSITTSVAAPLAPSDCLGATCPATDAGSFARRVRELLDQPLRAQVIGQAGRDWALKAFDPDLQADSLVALYRLAVDDREVPSPHLATLRSSVVD